jgi:hypothetical protein
MRSCLLSGTLMHVVTDMRCHVLVGVSPVVIQGTWLWTVSCGQTLTTTQLTRVDWFNWFTSVMCVIDKARTIVLCNSPSIAHTKMWMTKHS